MELLPLEIKSSTAPDSYVGINVVGIYQRKRFTFNGGLMTTYLTGDDASE